MKNEYSVIVPADEPAVLHRGYYGIDSALEEDYSYRNERFSSEEVYAAENHLQRECVRKWGKQVLISNSKKQAITSVH